MGGFIAKVIACLRWLFASERLPEPTFENGLPRSGAAHFLRWVLSGDELPSTDDIAPRRSERAQRGRVVRSVQECRWLEPLERRAAPGFLHWVSAREECPWHEPSSRARRRGFLRWVLAPDQLQG